MAHVENVECVDLVKKTVGGSKHVNVFVLQVSWSSKKTSRVGRPYTEFFDFRKTLQKEFKGKADIPELPGIRSFDKGLFGNKDPKKKKKTIEDFCQTILKLPKDVSKSHKVTEFFTAEKSAIRTIESQPVDTLQPLPVPDIIKQLRAHAFTDGAGKSPADRLPSLDGIVSTPLPLPIMRHSSENPDDAPVYIATSDYKKQRDNEIDLREGMQVTVMQKDMTGWWFVLVEDEGEGWAPGSLLEPQDLRPESTPTQPTGEPGLYQATRTQRAVNDDEVSYEEGDLVEVLEMRMDGWWSVRHKGKEGLMPAIHLEPVTREKGQTKKLTSSLYHHNSIYRKSSPPPRNIVSQTYATVNKVPKEPDKSAAKKPGGLTYAEITFETKPDSNGGGRMRPVILGDSSRTQYTEVLPISLPQHRPHESKASNGDEVDGHESKTKRPASETRKHNYMNWKTKPASSSYTNISLDNEIPRIEHHVFEVISDHDCPSLTSERLRVKRGDFVQAEKVEATRVLCTRWVEDKLGSELKGWIPMEKLKKIYTAETPDLEHAKSLPFPTTPAPPIPTHSQRNSQRNSHPPARPRHPRPPPTQCTPPQSTPTRTPPSRDSPTVSPRNAQNHSNPRESPGSTNPFLPTSTSKNPFTQVAATEASRQKSHSQTYENAQPLLYLQRNNAQPLRVNSDQPPPRGPGMPPGPSLPSPEPPAKPSPSKMAIPMEEAGQTTTVIVQAVWDQPEAREGGILAFQKGDRARLLCKNDKGWWGVLTDKERGWVPSAYWEVVEMRASKVPEPPPKSPAEPLSSRTPPAESSKSKKHHEAHLKQPWFVGKISRVNCEEIFQGHATDKDFVIRESTYRIGHFTLSMQYSNKVHHYPIVLTEDDKYYIGKHNFKNLCNVVSYYQTNPLMYDKNEVPLSLGTPFKK